MALTRFLQICVIVEDVEKARKYLTEEFGFKNWAPSGGDFLSKINDYTINGQPAKLDNRAAFCRAFGLEWELIQPSSGPLKAWIDEHGPGVHHFAVLTDDSYEEFGERCKRISGKDVWLHGESPTVGMDYSYYDLTKEIGMFLEVYNEARSHDDVGFLMDSEPD